jgi:hypothetical protein
MHCFCLHGVALDGSRGSMGVDDRVLRISGSRTMNFAPATHSGGDILIGDLVVPPTEVFELIAVLGDEQHSARAVGDLVAETCASLRRVDLLLALEKRRQWFASTVYGVGR